MLSKSLLSIIFSFPFLFGIQQDKGFKHEQKQFSRVRDAYTEYGTYAETLLQKYDKILLQTFKKEQLLELWANNKETQKFELVKTYDFCYLSGELGPKRKQGDGQVPEGFYHIDRFNPTSNFHLSLGINYPNSSDRILGQKGKLGGDIFIHGSCVSIGCIPIEDLIKELYVVCVEAKNKNQNQIPVYIFPFRLNDDNLKKYADDINYTFWKSLKEGSDYFEKNKKLPTVKVDNVGKYLFQ